MIKPSAYNANLLFISTESVYCAMGLSAAVIIARLLLIKSNAVSACPLISYATMHARCAKIGSRTAREAAAINLTPALSPATAASTPTTSKTPIFSVQAVNYKSVTVNAVPPLSQSHAIVAEIPLSFIKMDVRPAKLL